MDDVRENPLEQAAREGNLTKLGEVVAQGDFEPEVLGDAVRAAAENGQWEALQYLVSDVGAPLHKDDVGVVALQYAAVAGQLDSVKILVDRGISLQSRAGANALMAAATNGHLELLRYVAAHGADLKSCGGSAAVAAAKLGHWEEVAYLVTADADLTQDSVGAQLIAFAATCGQDEISQALLSKGVTLRPEVATVALKHLSSTYEWDICRDAARYLVTKGALTKSDAGDAALVTAAMFGDLDMVRCLANHGVDIASEAGGRALANVGLLGGCLDGDVKAVDRFLVDHGAIAPPRPILKIDEDF